MVVRYLPSPSSKISPLQFDRPILFLRSNFCQTKKQCCGSILFVTSEFHPNSTSRLERSRNSRGFSNVSKCQKTINGMTFEVKKYFSLSENSSKTHEGLCYFLKRLLVVTLASTCVNPTSVNDKPWRMI